MSIRTQPMRSQAERAQNHGQMPFIGQVAMLTRRALIVNLRVPAVIVPSLLINVFFLLVYEAQLGAIAGGFLRGQSFIGFILPLTIASAALGGSTIAGETIVTDIGRGYFDKLMLTPVSRWALLLGPMIAGAVLLALQSGLVILLGLWMGLEPATGVLGLAAIIGFALLLGVSFSGLTVGIALLTGNAAATGSAGLLFFPLTFLTATFVPAEQLRGWIKIAAQINPITYVLEAMRAILNQGWDADLLGRGLAAGAAMFGVLFAFALFSLRMRTRRR